MKQANDKIASTGAETQVQQVIAKETQKMNAQADAVKEVRTKASYRVVVNAVDEATIKFTGYHGRINRVNASSVLP
jgi:hypothetical protein